MLRTTAVGVGLATLVALSGCATMDPSVCKGLAIGTGALLGATTGGLVDGLYVDSNNTAGNRNWELGLSTAGGAAIGGLVGWGLSEAMCGEPAEAAPPPPPPPAARPAPPPPPPPPAPPVTQRRGG